VRYRDSGVLIGSNLLIPDVMKQFLRVTGAPLHEAVRFVTLNPARFLGLDVLYGSIEPGKMANLVVLDRDLDVSKVLKS
jgi:N-acetylglucosamine-6-phosphate deacetylase